MLHELRENSLAEIHLSLSAIATARIGPPFASFFVEKSSNRKNQTSP